MSQDTLKDLRAQTGAGLMDIKEALEEAGGDAQKAIDILRKKGAVKLSKKADRVAKEGIVESYIHAGGRIGVLVEINCETDFVARTDDFKQLARDLALHIAASSPQYLDRDEVPAELVAREQEIYREQAVGKPADVVEKMLDGKLEKFYEEICLMDQPYVKDGDIKVGQFVTNAVAKMGENVQVRRFARFVLGA